MNNSSCSSEPEFAPVEDVDVEIAVPAKALGNPIRVQILQMLLSHNSCCYYAEIVHEVPLAQATVAQHLRVLKDAGLVQSRVEGSRVCYCANPERIRQLAALLDGLCDT